MSEEHTVIDDKIAAFSDEPGAQPSRAYSVTAGGSPILVQQFGDIHYAHFAFSGTCKVDVSVGASIGEENVRFIYDYSIRPLRKEPRSTSHLNTVSFSLNEPVQLVIEIEKYGRLFLFADPADKGIEQFPAPRVVNVRDYVPDDGGTTVQTSRIQHAIEMVRKDGVLYFPPGIYRSGTLELKSDMTMYLAGGAVLRASDNPEDFPKVKTDTWIKQRFIGLEGMRNVRITGNGVIDGNGNIVRAQKCGPHLLVAHNCRNLQLDNFVARNPAAWCIHIVNCDDVSVRRVKVVDHRDVLNADGFDPESSRNVLIENCFAYTSDDSVVIKTHGEGEAHGITVKGCTLLSKKSALKIGTETHNDISSVRFMDNDVIECDRGMTVVAEDGATVSDIQYINNRFELPFPDSRRRLIDVYIWNRNGGGQILDLLIKDCTADTKWPRPSTLFPASGTIDGVRFDHFMIEGKIAGNLKEADLLIDDLPCCDDRRARVKNLSFEPTGKKGWNPALLIR